MGDGPLDQWIESVRPYRHIEDPMDLEVLMATYWANITPGPKVWLVLRSAPGVGGSRILKLFYKFPDISFIPSFTQAGFESHLKNIDKSYRSKTIPFKTHLIITDLTLMLTRNPETIDQLRLAYDGEFGREKYDSTYQQTHTFGFMAKATNQSLDRAADWFAELGPRTLEYRLAASPKSIVDSQKDEENKLAEQEITYHWVRDLIQEGYHQKFKEQFQEMEFGPKDELEDVVDLLCTARSNIPIHPTMRNYESPTDPESHNRPYAQLERLLTAYSILKGHDEVEWDLVKKMAKKIAIDSIPGWRHRIIQLFEQFDGKPQHPMALRVGIGLSLNSKGTSEATWRKLMEEMEMLGILYSDDKEVGLVPHWKKVLGEYKEEVPEAFRPPTPKDDILSIIARRYEESFIESPFVPEMDWDVDEQGRLVMKPRDMGKEGNEEDKEGGGE